MARPSAEEPVTHVLHGGVRGGGCRAQLSGLDNGGAAFLYQGNKGVVQPGIVTHGSADGAGEAGGGEIAHESVVDVRVLGGGVVAPDNDVTHVLARLEFQALAQLAKSAVVVQPRHGGEVLRRETLGACEGDECVGVGRVPDDAYLHVPRRVAGQGQPLLLEDGRVFFQQVRPLHPLAAGERPYEHRHVHPLARPLDVRGGHDAAQQWKRAVLQLHRYPLHRPRRRRNI
mmetsp:Transcript_23045/g.64742  ORF Transcript_23045/g.64742 Transcript_23045/m.64742 type:complete len:229 (-) Transcript_23045:138-824(-)